MTTVSPTYSVDLEAFTLNASDGQLVHYEADDNLAAGCSGSLGSGQRAGLVLVELGIDGYATHRVRVGLGRVLDHGEPDVDYERDQSAAIDDALDALEAVRDQLEAMRTPQAARAAERRDVARLVD